MAPIGVTLRVNDDWYLRFNSGLFELLPYLDGSRLGVEPACSAGLNGFFFLSSAISVDCFTNMSARLFVNSTMTSTNWNGVLIVASLWLKSTANRMLACVISRSFV